MKHLRSAWCDTPTYINPYDAALSLNTSTLECRWDSSFCNLRIFFFSAGNHDGVLVASCSLQCFGWPLGWTIEKLKKWYIWGQQMLSPSYARLSRSPWQSGAKRRPPSCCLRPVDICWNSDKLNTLNKSQTKFASWGACDWITARRLHQFKTRMERTKSHPRWAHWWLTWFLMLGQLGRCGSSVSSIVDLWDVVDIRESGLRLKIVKYIWTAERREYLFR